MSRILLEEKIDQVLSRGDKLFVPYVMCGDGGFDKTENLVRVLEDAGASVIEIGVPFSDPIADGPSIQAAGQRALDQGVNLKRILSFLEQLAPKHNVPRVMMTYLNPILQFGLGNFFSQLKAAHISGLIIPDLPMEEYDLIYPYACIEDIAIIPLVAPSTSLDRMERLLEKTSGFIYTVTVNGTTGARTGFDRGITQRLSDIKERSGRPVVAGFGVSTPEQVAMLSAYCDGVVVGSKIVDLAHENRYDAITQLVTASLK